MLYLAAMITNLFLPRRETARFQEQSKPLVWVKLFQDPPLKWLIQSGRKLFLTKVVLITLNRWGMMRDFSFESVWRNPLHFVACGFGVGTIPFMPGTMGT